MVDEMKEGIMERDEAKNGVWGDVTDDCVVSVAYNSGGLCAFVQHDGHRIAWLGTRVNVEDKNDPCYRVTEYPSTVESGGIKVEHFIPDPEWVDVTMECLPYMYRAYDGSESNVEVRHDGNIVATLGGDEPYIPGKDDYRVTFAKDGVLMSGSIKVDKRND